MILSPRDLIGSPSTRWLLIGMGVTNRSVAGALVRRGRAVVAVDDNPDELLRGASQDLGMELVEAPSDEDLDRMIFESDVVVPAPGLPESHRAFSSADAAGRMVLSELDLAAVWDDRPVIAITGTNGKTTVVELVVDCLGRSGMSVLAAGNTDLPLVSAIEDPSTDVFVVEASSFRLARTTEFRPDVATWLNFAPDHLDVHSSLDAYENAKAAIWARATASTVVIANSDDPAVMSHVPGSAKLVTFGAAGSDWYLDDQQLLCGPGGPLMAKSDLWRSLPHDVTDALAAASTAIAIGADRAAVVETLRSFPGLAHRVDDIGTVAGSTFYDDSKATTPHATVSALSGFESVVLIAGGRNKEIDLSSLLAGIDHVACVVAIGEAAEDMARVFEAHCAVEIASDMDDAVRRAARLATGGRPVLLSPGCASFDWYRNYGERGDDFVRAVADLATTTEAGSSPVVIDEDPT